ncbi:MAG: dUTP diphosphatase [Deltaproteobacteria bacterium]|nr:dUTP diphosphatase [Deltaproteobacteria bacterium]
MTVEVRVVLAPDANPRPEAVGEPIPVPRQATPLAAGLDLLAWVAEPITLQPGARSRIPTGVCLEIPPGYEGQVRPRSGLAANHGVTVLNAPGTVDADYRGQVAVILVNLSDRPYTVRRGDRVAQLVVCPVAHPVRVSLVDALGETGRGGGGFGSTGV